MSSKQTGLLCAIWCLIVVDAAPSQEKVLTRTFSPGAREAYRVDLTIRSEVRGVSAETIGAKTYVKPLLHEAEGTLVWSLTRRVLSVSPEGSAEIEESLDRPSGACPVMQEEGSGASGLQGALQRICESWEEPRTMRYREARDGHVRGLDAVDAPWLSEDSPALLSLWLVRALRPSAILPAEPLRIGEHWRRETHGAAPPWEETRGFESGEWSEATGPSAAAILRTTQELAGSIPASKELASMTGVARELQKGGGRFFAESLATISVLDGSLLEARRSASRETTWTLTAVEGLPAPPQFSEKLSVTLTIRRLR